MLLLTELDFHGRQSPAKATAADYDASSRRHAYAWPNNFVGNVLHDCVFLCLRVCVPRCSQLFSIRLYRRGPGLAPGRNARVGTRIPQAPQNTSPSMAARMRRWCICCETSVGPVNRRTRHKMQHGRGFNSEDLRSSPLGRSSRCPGGQHKKVTTEDTHTRSKPNAARHTLSWSPS